MEARLSANGMPPPRKLSLTLPTVWLRFLLSIGGLGLAFVAALFSTVSRQAGSLWQTLIFASVSLILAVVIGVTTVPYLAKRVAGNRIRAAVDYRVTKLGLIYVTVVLLIGIAALNTGNNLLYIIVAAMLAAIVVSGVVSATVLRNLELDVRIPEHVFAGEPVRAHLSLKNPRRWLPCFSVSVVPFKKDKESHQWQWKATTFAFPPMRPPQKQWLKLPDRKLLRVPRAAKTDRILSGATYFPFIPSRSSIKADLELTFARRGRYKEESFGLASGFPFAFLVKTRHVPLMREIVVYPSVQRAREHIELLSAIAGEIETFSRGNGNDLYRLREYMPDDSARHVDWKATAKTGALKVREFSREENRRLRIVFDNPQPGTLSAKKYEDAVATAASLAWHLTAPDVQAAYVTQGYRGSPDIHSFLRFLATADPSRSPSPLDALSVSGEFNVIITARTADAIPANLKSCSYLVLVQESKG